MSHCLRFASAALAAALAAALPVAHATTDSVDRMGPEGAPC
jgi:hypothetical protein